MRGPYKILTPVQKFDIGKRAAEIGTTSAMHYYAKSYPHLDLKETFVRRFKNHYQIQLKTSTKEISGSSTVQELVPKKRGHPLMVGEELDEQVREYIRELRWRDTGKGYVIKLNKLLTTKYMRAVYSNSPSW